MPAGDLDLALLSGAGVLLVAIGGMRLSSRIGVPSLLLYLGLGMLLGEDAIGVRFDNARTARDLGLVCLALIVSEGGLTTHWRTVRPVLPYSSALATVGVAASIGVTAVAAHLVMDIDWRTSGIVAAVLSPTDAAAVFSTLRHLRLPQRVVGLLEAESGLNDAPVVILVTLLSAHHVGSAGHAALQLGYQLAVGLAIGVAVGAVAVTLLRGAALPAAGLYPVATMAFAVASYAAASSAKASGFLAVYVTSVAMGNARLPHRRATLGFAEGLAWLAQIGLFVMLGLLSTPSRLAGALLPALGVGMTLLLVARPLSVLVSTPGRGVSWRERAFCSVAGLRGAVPIVLTTIPMTSGVRGANRLFDVVFVLVVVFTLVQAPALAPLARGVGLASPERSVDLEVEAAPLDDLMADLLTVRIPQKSRLHGVEVWELRLPVTASVTFIVRDGHGFVPDTRTALRDGDDLLIITARSERDAVERRLRAIGRSGRLAGFFGDRGEEQR